MERKWWKEASVYQIYPRSFMDSNNDGIGDLKGITGKLDYIKNLGVDVIWLSPFYDSPNDDNGYDISDYRKIHPDFGTMEDFDEMLRGIHERGMKLMIDLVVNHSSDEHFWFRESRKSKDNRYRDYYIWKDPKDGGYPNNWESVFSGPAWEFDEKTGQYYLHLFSRKQPDLNWDNPVLREEIYDMMRFWLNKGVDGFRMDVINLISKKFYENGEDEDINFMGPRLHEFLHEMNEKVLSHYDIMTVGECPGATVSDAILFADPDREELQMIFTFEHMDIDNGKFGKWDPVPFDLLKLKKVLDSFQIGLSGKAWNSLYLDNHDQPRVVSRFGNDSEKYRVISAKMLSHITGFMQGTPYIYQGEELGMTNLDIESEADFRDIETINAYRDLSQKGLLTKKEIMRGVRARGRDNARSPIQWTGGKNGGFSECEPWIKVNKNHTFINAESQVNDPDSVYSHYRKILSLRKELPVIVYGEYEPLLSDNPDVYAWKRTLGDEMLLCYNNFTDKEITISAIACTQDSRFRVLLSNYEDRKYSGENNITLKPYEGIVLYNR